MGWSRVSGLDFLVPGFGFRVPGSGFRVPGSGFWVLGSGFWVPGFGARNPDRPTQEINSTRVAPAQFSPNHLAEMCTGSEAGSYVRLINVRITQL